MKIFLPFFLLFLFEKSSPAGHATQGSSYASEDSFLMPIEDVFTISGRGTVAVGTIERGMIKAGDSVEIIGMTDKIFKSKISGIEAFRQIKQEAKKGENVGLLLTGIEKTDIKRGMVICHPGTLTTHTEFSCQLQLKTKENGGRSTPVFSKYRPQFRFRTADVSGEIILPADKQELKPGEIAMVTVKLNTPVAMEKNYEIAVREGGRDIGTAKILDILK